MATSALLCESALIGWILFLPATPPRSLTRSIAIWAPIDDAIDPAAANGPERSYRTPIRMGGSSALANRPPTLSAATVRAECLRSDLRDVSMVTSLCDQLRGWSFALEASIWRGSA